MPKEFYEDRIVFSLSCDDDAIDLEKLSEGFVGLASQFRRHLTERGVNPINVDARLYVTKVQSGSLEFELGTALALYLALQTTVDGFVIWADFFDRLKRSFEYLAGREKRPAHYEIEDARNLDAFLGTVAGQRGGSLKMRRARFHQRTGDRETLAEFDFNESDVSTAHLRLMHDLTGAPEELENASAPHRLVRRVPFIWHRTDREKGKSAGQTSDRGVVADVTEKPLPVYFASESDSKERMNRIAGNPLIHVYLVDVDVELDETGAPQRYTILNIYNDGATRLRDGSTDSR